MDTKRFCGVYTGMKAMLLKDYGDVDQLYYGEAPTPSPGPGEVLVKVVATSVNPIDWKIRKGQRKDKYPQIFPAILGRDAAGTVEALGAGVKRFKPGDKVMGLISGGYAEYLTAKAEWLAPVPEDMKLKNAAAYPLVIQTGAQLIERAAKPGNGETILITGALGSVGRVAVYVAKERGARVIAGVRARQKEQAAALGAYKILALDSDEEISKLEELDCIADTVNGETIAKLIPHLKKGGRLGSVLGEPAAAQGKDIEVVAITAEPDAEQLSYLANAVQNGLLIIPIAARMMLEQAGEAQEKAEKGAGGKIVLTVS